jgi:hypothetical protein
MHGRPRRIQPEIFVIILVKKRSNGSEPARLADQYEAPVAYEIE